MTQSPKYQYNASIVVRHFLFRLIGTALLFGLFQSASKAQGPTLDVEDIQKFYKKTTEDVQILPESINGYEIYKIIHCSIEDPTPKYGEFTSSQFKLLKDFSFNDWEKCVAVCEYIQTSMMIENENKETITIKSNASGFAAKTLEDNIDLGNSKGNILLYTFENLKKKYLSVELTHPEYDSEMAELDKKVRGGYVFMKLSQTTIDKLARELYLSKSLDELEKLIQEHPYSKSHRKAIAFADSIRIERALSRGDEIGFQYFLKERPASTMMKLAEEWIAYFEKARVSYEKAKINNDLESYETFLKSFELSKFVPECKLKLIDAAATKFIQSSDPDSILFFYTHYLDKYKETTGFKKNYFDITISNMVNALEKKYLGDQTNTLNVASFNALWEHKHRIEKSIGQTLSKLESRHKSNICQAYFEQLTSTISLESQNQMEESFKKLYYEFPTDNPISFILDNAINKNGNVTVYHLNYLVNDLNIKLGDKFSDQTTHLSVTHSLKTTLSIENLKWVDNNYQGLQSVSNAKGKFYEINFTSYPIFDAEHFYKDGVLAKSSFYNDEGLIYIYEFQNGKNLTLANLQEEINLGDMAYNERRYQDALVMYLDIRENPYPASAPQNEYLSKAIKRTEDKIAAQEQYRYSKARFKSAYRSNDQIEIDGVAYNLMLIFPPIPNKVIMTYAYVYDTRAIDSPCEGTYSISGKDQLLMVRFNRSSCNDFNCYFEFDEYSNEIRSITVNNLVLFPTD
jgi:hypothetical protein